MKSAGKKNRMRQAVEELLAVVDPDVGNDDPRRRRLLGRTLEHCLAMAMDGIEVVDLKLVESAMDEIRRALACFRPYDSVRKVTVFGSARLAEKTPEYALAREFSRRIHEAGFMVITGAGPGLMQACQEGAGTRGSFGVNILLPFENVANDFIRGDDKLVEFKYFFTRKLFFLKEASAVVVFPGGFGTHDEGFETLTLVQTGKAQMMPVVLLDLAGNDYWRHWRHYVEEQLLGRGLISGQDTALFRITDDIDEAVAEIASFYRVFHSSRVIRGRTVLRINHELGPEVLDALSGEFADVTGGRRLKQRGAFKEEFDEPSIAGLPRLVADFDMQSYGRLRLLINRLNELG